MLSHALAFAREGTGVCPLFLDEPLEGARDGDRREMFSTILDALPGKQTVFLLSDPGDIDALRATGRADKELEIRG